MNGGAFRQLWRRVCAARDERARGRGAPGVFDGERLARGGLVGRRSCAVRARDQECSLGTTGDVYVYFNVGHAVVCRPSSGARAARKRSTL